jgi:hypothetical protein
MNFAVGGGAGVVEGTHEASKLGTQVDRFRSLLACLARTASSPKTAWMSTTIDCMVRAISTIYMHEISMQYRAYLAPFPRD